ncbi:MAG: ATP-binding protein [Desulfopila sp.]|nr:ATP-binding protein [Desulfopila sp.]
MQRWKDRPDSEHEQAIIRLFVGGAATIYVFVMLWRTHGHLPMLTTSLIAGWFVLALIIIGWIFLAPGSNIPRRLFGSIIDNGGATALLFLNGNLAAPVFIVYLWVAFGNGFRFGRKYLLFSTILAILGFSSVLIFSELWQMGRTLNAGLLVGLIALPLYVSALLGRLEKALERAEAANRAKSNFLATMSHEIRTPLNGLIGILDLLDVKDFSPQQKHYVELLKSSSEWLLNILSDGLDFTKIEAGELIMDPAPMDLGTLLHDMANVYREVAGRSGITFSLETRDLSVKYIVCDKNRLTQILNNLLSNGCKFTDKGEVVLQVTSKKIDEMTAVTSFFIRDTGIGISHEQLEKIFLPFKQLQLAENGRRKGSGLGLTISRRLVELLGSSLKVQSTPGKGTVFSFSIETPVTTAAKIPGIGSSLQHPAWKRPPRILLVEDNDINREVAGEYLKRLGCEYTAVENGHKALELTAMDRAFDLILMDCEMPVLDGYAATREIRARESGSRSHTIVALTAHITNQDRERCFRAGMDDYMGKPYRIDTLQNLLYKWLKSLIAADDIPAVVRQDEDCIPEPTAQQSTIRGKPLHDLRNSLTGVIGGVELALLCCEDPQKCEKHLQTAREAAQKALEVAQKL